MRRALRGVRRIFLLRGRGQGFRELAELVGDGAPAIVEAHLLMPFAVGLVLVQRDRLVMGLAPAGVFLEVVEGKRLVFTDAFRPGWRPAGRAFMAAEVLFEDASGGKTAYTARAMHWSAEARLEHEKMGFHEGWGKAADQLEALAKTL